MAEEFKDARDLIHAFAPQVSVFVAVPRLDTGQVCIRRRQECS